MTTPEAVAALLARAGTGALFGVPGSGPSYRVIAGMDEAGVPFFGATHEAAAAIMAGAFGRQSGTVGCAISIKGPGLTNMLPGIASNHFERNPTLTISEAVGPATPPGRVHKRLDHRMLLRGLVKAYATWGNPEESVGALLDVARAGIPGPVHLDLTAGEHTLLEVFAEPPARAGDGAWMQVTSEIARSRRPVLVVGSVANGAPWRDALAALRIPVLTTLAAKGAVDEHSSHAAGVFTGDGKALSPEHRLLREADLVVGLGLRNFEILNPAAISTRCVLVDTEPSDAATGFAAEAVYANAGPDEIGNLIDQLRSHEWGADVIAEATGALREQLLQHPWLPARAFDAIQALLPAATFVADTGAFCTIAEHVWRAPDPGSFLCSANGRYMGTGLPMAIGAALAGRGRPVVCAVGDGGARMYFAELKLAVEHRLPIIVFLASDGEYSSIAASVPEGQRRARVLSIPRPSWHAAAAAVGCAAVAVESTAELDHAIRRWSPDSGPLFVEARFEPEAYRRMTEQLR